MVERLKALVLKTSIGSTYRGFKSHFTLISSSCILYIYGKGGVYYIDSRSHALALKPRPQTETETADRIYVI